MAASARDHAGPGHELLMRLDCRPARRRVGREVSAEHAKMCAEYGLAMWDHSSEMDSSSRHEPTNHLDLTAIGCTETANVRRVDGTLIAVVTDVLEARGWTGEIIL